MHIRLLIVMAKQVFKTTEIKLVVLVRFFELHRSLQLVPAPMSKPARSTPKRFRETSHFLLFTGDAHSHLVRDCRVEDRSRAAPSHFVRAILSMLSVGAIPLDGTVGASYMY